MNDSFNIPYNPGDPEFPYDPPMIEWMWDGVNGILTVIATGNGSLLLELSDGDQVLQYFGENEVSCQTRSQVGFTHQARACVLIGDRIVSYWCQGEYTIPPMEQNNVYGTDVPENPEYGNRGGFNGETGGFGSGGFGSGDFGSEGFGSGSHGSGGNSGNHQQHSSGSTHGRGSSAPSITLPLAFDRITFKDKGFINNNDESMIRYDMETSLLQQPTISSCWITSLAMLLDFAGLYTKPRPNMSLDETCNHIENLLKAIDSFNGTAFGQLFRPLSLNGISQYNDFVEQLIVVFKAHPRHHNCPHYNFPYYGPLGVEELDKRRHVAIDNLRINTAYTQRIDLELLKNQNRFATPNEKEAYIQKHVNKAINQIEGYALKSNLQKKFFEDCLGFKMELGTFEPIMYYRLLVEYGPLIIAYDGDNGTDESTYHYVVLCGMSINQTDIDSTTFLVADPWTGQQAILSYQEFYQQTTRMAYDNVKLKEWPAQIIHFPNRCFSS